MVNTARVEPTQGGTVRGLPLATLNHISVLCRCLPSSLTFYTDVLGFVPIHRPGSLNFAGAWYVRSRQQRFKKMQPLQLHSLMTPSFRFCVV
jgi:catechol 2,3-dioxygenase-like lactoylglutathione lyase family enzyme